MNTVTIKRKTKETDIQLSITVLGERKNNISTGIGFFDHMMTALAVHSGMDISLQALGDLQVDAHHTVEDVGIVLGQAYYELWQNRKNLHRYGQASIPMDEALGTAILDISNRPFLMFQAQFTDQKIGMFDTCLIEEFFRAVAMNARITLHLSIPYGENDHHKCEALFKAFAHALKMAFLEDHTEQILSTKGVL